MSFPSLCMGSGLRDPEARVVLGSICVYDGEAARQPVDAWKATPLNSTLPTASPCTYHPWTSVLGAAPPAPA